MVLSIVLITKIEAINLLRNADLSKKVKHYNRQQIFIMSTR